MSGMIDGVNKFFTVHHEGGSMHIEGYKTREEAALQLLRAGSNRHLPFANSEEYWQHHIDYWKRMQQVMLAEQQRVERERQEELNPPVDAVDEDDEG